MQQNPKTVLWALTVLMITPLSACGAQVDHVAAVGNGTVQHLAVSGDRLCTNDGVTLRMFDISRLSAPRELRAVESPDMISAMIVIQKALYFETGIKFRQLETEPSSVDQQWIKRGWLSVDGNSYSKGYFVGVSNLVRINRPDRADSAVVPVANLTPDDTLASRVTRLNATNTRLYASLDPMGTLIFDLHREGDAKLAGRYARGMRVAVAEPYLYVADGAGVTVSSIDETREYAGGLAIIDATDAAALREIGRIPAKALSHANVTCVAASGRYVYINGVVVKNGGWGGADDYLITVDVSTPAVPKVTRREKLTRFITDIFVADKTLYLLMDNSSLVAYDLTDPAQPRRRGAQKLRGEVLSSAVAHPFLYTGTFDGVHIYKFHQP